MLYKCFLVNKLQYFVLFHFDLSRWNPKSRIQLCVWIKVMNNYFYYVISACSVFVFSFSSYLYIIFIYIYIYIDIGQIVVNV